jgi:hypothetical protein
VKQLADEVGMHPPRMSGNENGEALPELEASGEAASGARCATPLLAARLDTLMLTLRYCDADHPQSPDGRTASTTADARCGITSTRI